MNEPGEYGARSVDTGDSIDVYLHFPPFYYFTSGPLGYIIPMIFYFFHLYAMIIVDCSLECALARCSQPRGLGQAHDPINERPGDRTQLRTLRHSHLKRQLLNL